MARLVGICLVSIAAFCFVACSEETISSNIELNVVEDLYEFLEKNPDAVPLERNDVSPMFKTTYRLGKRINGNKINAGNFVICFRYF